MSTEDLMKEWFDSEIKPDKVTMEEFDKFVEEYLAVRAEADDLDDKLTSVNKRLMKMSGRLIEFLEIQGKDKHVTSVGTITRVETKTWKAPEGENRLALMEYLKEKNLYDNVMAFNAKKFSSWFQGEKESNPDFDFKGIEQTSTKYIRFNGSKK